MNLKDKGLTVGELTIAISALIIAALIWSNISQKDSSQANALNKNSTLNTNLRSLKY